MKKIATLKLPTYDCKLVLVVTDELTKTVNNIYKKYKLDSEFEVDAEGVMLSPSMTDYYMIIDTEYLTHNTIAHEAFHATNMILKDRDIMDEESGAWIAGHISEFIYKSLNKNKFTVKHG